MDFIKEVLNDPVTKVLAIIVVFYAVKEIIMNWEWIKQRLDKRYKDKQDAEDEQESLEQRVRDIACTSEKHTQTLEQIGDALNNINNTLQDMEKERDEDIVANGRATMYHLYEKLKDQPTISTSEYETFHAIAERYLAAGGNAVFKDKIIPEIYAKPVDND